jgi:hypothetical protein
VKLAIREFLPDTVDGLLGWKALLALLFLVIVVVLRRLGARTFGVLGLF